MVKVNVSRHVTDYAVDTNQSVVVLNTNIVVSAYIVNDEQTESEGFYYSGGAVMYCGGTLLRSVMRKGVSHQIPCKFQQKWMRPPSS